MVAWQTIVSIKSKSYINRIPTGLPVGMSIKHNFVYHPNQEDEFWIDWYKYPFRDSYCNKDLNKKEILDIFQDCINQFLKKYDSQ